MRRKKFIVFIFFLVLFITFGFYLLWDYAEYIVDISNNEVKTNHGELTFLTAKDKQQIFSSIDSATSLSGFDKNMYNTLSDILDSYNNQMQSDDMYLLTPEFLSDNPEGVVIHNGDQKIDLLEGIDIVTLTNSDLPALRSFAKLFIEEYSRYPLAWLPHVTPPVIVFVKSAGIEGEVVGGVEQGVIVYNISVINDQDFSRRLVHHELMHWVELLSNSYYDTQWPGQDEDYSHKYDLSSQYNLTEHPKKGFITGYAQTNSQEDKAELYSFLFTPNGIKKLNSWRKKDELIDRKVDYLKNFIKQRVDKMDDTYFEDYILNN